VAALAALVLSGCGPSVKARLWADTALADGQFSLQAHQWAYDGEPVTFELECSPSLANFVIFGVDGHEMVVNVTEVAGRYRWTHAFRCGPQPQVYEVYVIPYIMRGRCDWIKDRDGEGWSHFPGRNDSPDIATDREKIIKITCYRVEVRLPFIARGGPPRRVELSLAKAGGERKSVPRRLTPSAGAQGFLLLGPEANGLCEVVYVPRFDEVGRAGKTLAELLVEHADGSLEKLQQELETP
jgi:hypothetical protein